MEQSVPEESSPEFSFRPSQQTGISPQSTFVSPSAEPVVPDAVPPFAFRYSHQTEFSPASYQDSTPGPVQREVWPPVSIPAAAAAPDSTLAAQAALHAYVSQNSQCNPATAAGSGATAGAASCPFGVSPGTASAPTSAPAPAVAISFAFTSGSAEKPQVRLALATLCLLRFASSSLVRRLLWSCLPCAWSQLATVLCAPAQASWHLSALQCENQQHTAAR